MDRWIAEQLEHPQAGTGRPVAAATVTRRLSCLAGLYEYAVVDAGLLEASPVVRVKRPRVSDRSSTTGLTETELIALLGAADADGPRSAALVTLLALNGLRVGEALALDAPDLTYDLACDEDWYRILNGPPGWGFQALVRRGAVLRRVVGWWCCIGLGR